MIRLTGEVTLSCDTVEEWDAVVGGLSDLPPGALIVEQNDPERFVRLSLDQDFTHTFIPPPEE